MKKQSIIPLHDRIVIKPAPSEDISAGGIFIPSTAKEKPSKGEIVAVGKGLKDAPLSVKVGDTVHYGKHAGVEIDAFGGKSLIMKEFDVLAII